MAFSHATWSKEESPQRSWSWLTITPWLCRDTEGNLATIGRGQEARREATLFNAMRPDFVPNVVTELTARNFQPADQARLIADLRKAGLPASDEVRASMLLPLHGPTELVPR